MPYEYVRIDIIRMIGQPDARHWLDTQSDCEWRQDYQCWFILNGSKTHTMAALKFGDIFG